MHIEKYKIDGCNAMVLHYQRGRKGTLDRENIDKNKTHLNFEFGEKFNYQDLKKILNELKEETGRAVRKDAITMSDIVVTAPPNVWELKPFFEAVFESLKNQLFENGLYEKTKICGYVHLDETTPHMHFCFVPLKINNKNEKIFSFKTICKRSLYQSLHTETENYCEEKLGYRPSLLIVEDDNLNSLLSRADIDQKAYKQLSNRLKNEIDKEILEAEQVLDEKKVILSQLKATLKTQKRKLLLQKFNPRQNRRIKELNSLENRLEELKILSQEDMSDFLELMKEEEEFYHSVRL